MLDEHRRGRGACGQRGPDPGAFSGRHPIRGSAALHPDSGSGEPPGDVSFDGREKALILSVGLQLDARAFAGVPSRLRLPLRVPALESQPDVLAEAPVPFDTDRAAVPLESVAQPCSDHRVRVLGRGHRIDPISAVVTEKAYLPAKCGSFDLSQKVPGATAEIGRIYRGDYSREAGAHAQQEARPSAPSGPCTVTRPWLVLRVPWAWISVPGARVAAATAPDNASGGASEGEPERTCSRSSASGFQALKVPAAW